METLHGGLSNQEETETSTATEIAVLAVAVAQVTISDAECAIISSQRNATRGVDHPQSIAQRRLCLPEFWIASARKCPLCQLTIQIKPLVKAKKFTTTALYSFQVICADHIGPLPEGYQ